MIKNWENFATVQKWKRRLMINSIVGGLHKGTNSGVNNVFPALLKFTKMNPDELVEMAKEKTN